MSYTEKDFKKWGKFEMVKSSSHYNMILDFAEASKECGLSLNEYSRICRKYSLIKDKIIEKYGSVENYMKKQEVKKNEKK